MTDNEKQKLYKLIIESYNRSILKGSCVFDWVNHIRKYGCVLHPSPKNMMLSSMGRFVKPNKFNFNKKRNFVRVKTNSFGNIYVPEKLAFKSLVMEFFP